MNGINHQVSIVIIVWKRPELTRKCIASALAQNYKNFNVIIIDNNSNIDLSDFSNNDKTIIIKNKKNFGCTIGFNMGMEFAIKTGSKYTFMLNNDLAIGHDLLTKFMFFIKDKKKVGVIGLSIIEDGVYSIGGEFDLKKRHYHRLIFKRLPRVNDIPDSTVLAPSAPVMLISCEVYKKIGSFDSSFFAYWEDIDFFWRVLQSGYHNYVIIDQCIEHKIERVNNVLIKTTEAYFYFYMARNYYFFLRNAWDGKVPLRYIFWWLAETFNVYHYEKKHGNKKHMGVIIDAIYCAFFNKGGEWDKNNKSQKAPVFYKALFICLAYFFN